MIFYSEYQAHPVYFLYCFNLVDSDILSFQTNNKNSVK